MQYTGRRTVPGLDLQQLRLFSIYEHLQANCPSEKKQGCPGHNFYKKTNSNMDFQYRKHWQQWIIHVTENCHTASFLILHASIISRSWFNTEPGTFIHWVSPSLWYSYVADSIASFLSSLMLSLHSSLSPPLKTRKRKAGPTESGLDENHM